jgi:response regulator of citrate/malate metabolism
VLLVEDDVLIALDLEDMLEQLGFAGIRLARRLDAARKACREAAFDLAVFDLNLAGVSSLPLIEEQVAAGCAVIVTSGSDGEKEALGALGVPVLLKPVSRELFEKALEEFGL